jgi:hypothetical protein
MDSPLSFKLNDIIKLKYEHNTILFKQVSTMVLKIKQKRFELGDKLVKLLVYQLRGI